ncbi:hypothetical protein [Nocardia sp. NPDC024068]|uniref:hypothetical protein n=1 Tax=Nocardia sp. NPDC024068 TaxID=3157197 RepID=UPI003411A891
MDDALAVLRKEFDAEPGSFLLKLRSELEWDRAGFTRLERAMRAVCDRTQRDDHLPRWIAEGFYSVSSDVPDWTAHPNFPRPDPVGYYDACIERLTDLADWYFRGWHAYQEPHVWIDL